MSRGAAYFRYWAKSDREDPRSFHLLPYHMLDVAAVFEGLLIRRSAMLRHFSRAFGVEDEVFLRFATFLVALHDIGKIAEPFQRRLPSVFRELFPERAEHHWESAHHTRLGSALWHHELRPALAKALGIPALATRGLPRECPIGAWALTSFHHHGRPVLPLPGRWRRQWSRFLDAGDLAAAKDLHADLVSLFDLGEIARHLPKGDVSPAAREATWWLAGVTTVADWLGSNRRHFDMRQDARPLSEYWECVARPAAARALQATTLVPTPAGPPLPAAELVGIASSDLRPMQRAAAEIDLSDGPLLVVIEDSTGSGKTEAALIIAHRLLSSGGGDGLYFALPTMATANAMYDRVAEVYRKLFADAPSPSLVLAHSARDRSTSFRTTIGLEDPPGEAAYGNGEATPASAICNAWFADHPKKALLADAGVGTVDQALRAVLRCRHQPLRAYGLYRKALVVDEVHAYDPYQNRLLQHLLAMHAAGGGSAILLSATLPDELRHGLIEAFCGRPGKRGEAESAGATAYPLLTVVKGNGSARPPQEVAPHERRTLPVRLVHRRAEVVEALLEAAEHGCAVWVRNTVADAVEAFQELAVRHPKERLHLFHARFALGDRLTIEGEILRLFGKHSGPRERTGRIVIATQVVEQSLDLDFDLVVTDLAPVELVLQRLGRGRRHARSIAGQCIQGKDERLLVPFLVFAPEPASNPTGAWLHESFGRYHRVYPDHGRLWLTARLIAEHPQISVPDALRGLIETVYGEGSFHDIPEALQGMTGEVEGRGLSERSQASGGAVDFASGYSGAEGWVDEEHRTRLVDPTVTLRLARVTGDSCEPWCGDWRASEVTVRRDRWLDAVPVDSHLAALKAQLESADGNRVRFWTALPLVEEAEGLGRCVLLTRPESGRPRQIRGAYDATTGLSLE